MNFKLTWLVVLLACAAHVSLATQVVETPGRIDAVTVYRGQALTTRLVDLDGPAGLREIVVTDLPEHVVPGSLHAESADGVAVRSVRYRVRPVLRDVRAEVRALDERIREVRDKEHANVRQQQLVTKQGEYLDALEGFVAPTANMELTRGVLNADTLQKLTTFLYGQRKTLAEDELRLELDERDLAEERGLLERQRGKLTGSSSRTAREAVVFVNLQEGGGRLRLRYLVDRATWSPSYNVRTDSERPEVLVEYNASIQQMSGEDWNDVAMTLSTATPSLVATSPVLTPLAIKLVPVAEQQVQAGRAAGYKAKRQELLQRRLSANSIRNSVLSPLAEPQQQADDGAVQFGDVAGLNLNWAEQDVELNRVANELQSLDLTTRGRIRRGQQPDTNLDEAVTVTYSIPTRTSLPSRSDRQLIQIAAMPMAGSFYKVSTPVLASQVYEEAALTNESEIVLLAGPAASYRNGEFVGHGTIPTVAVGEGFTVGLGIDPSLRSARELIERKEVTQGGNRVVDLTYRLTLENFGERPAKVRVLDRLPQPGKSDIKLTLGDTKPDLSDDADYRHAARKKGILRWDVEVPAQANGTQSTTVEYEFRLEYDKEMTITGMAAATR